MTGTPNGAVAPDDGQGIPADLLADEPPAQAEPTAEDLARKAEAEKEELHGRIRAQEDMIRQQNKMLSDLSEQVKTIGDRTKAVDDRSREAQDRGWQYAVDETRARMRRAVAEAANSADTAKAMAEHDAAERDLDILLRNRPAASQKTDDPPKPSEAKPDPDLLSWLNTNPWYNYDWEARSLFDGNYAALIHSEPGLTTKERLAKAKDAVAKRLPDKFPNAQARSNAQTVARPGPQTAKGKPRAKTEADLPPGARAAMERFVKQGVLTKEQYLKDYQWDSKD